MSIPSSKPEIMLGSINVPSLMIGTAAWGDSLLWEHSSEENIQEIDNAFESMLNTEHSIFLDTAEIYANGKSEEIIGNLLEKYKSHPNIGNVKIATKYMPFPWRIFQPSSLINALKGSLKRLKIDCLDLYQIHGPLHLQSIETIASALAEAYKQGLVKAVGVSNYSLSQVKRMYEALKEYSIPLASNQVEFSLLRRYPEKSGLLAYCKEKGIKILAYSSLGMGRLTGKYSKTNTPSKKRFLSNYNMEEIEPLLEVMRYIAEKRNTSISSVALNYIIFKGAIPLAGVKNVEQAKANSQALGWLLTQEEVNKLENHTFDGNSGYFWQHG